MRNSFKRDYHFIQKKTFILSTILFFFLTLLVAYSGNWNIDNIHTEKLNLALAEAKANWNKDASFRKWATLHGGLYVKPDKRTPPNPALAHLPNRDVVTTKGQKLTLMNPAYMMRQMTQEFEDNYGIKGKITGKLQLNPINKPDKWQLKILNQFETGNTNEVYEQKMIDGQPYLRYMKPMFMTEGCVKCHGILGFKDGDLRGGVSVSIPLKPYFILAEETSKSIFVTHFTIWFLGSAVILIFAWFTHRVLLKMAHNTLHDQLTGLPNITLFKNRLNQSFKKYKRDPKQLFCVTFFDLDRFKNLNDSRGHKIGDELLIALSQQLSNILRPGDSMARMGGDEFTLLFEQVKNLDDSIHIAERIQLSLQKPFKIGNEELYINASMGICLITEHYRDAEDMIRDADIAMYRAKAQGKGCIDVFNPEMHDFAKETMEIENALRTAIQKEQLEVYYQPVIDTQNNSISGFEALLRWHHPTMGFISPERFIPIAEHSGQMNSIGNWVLEQACTQTHDWNLQFCSDNPLSIAVNISGVQLNENTIHKTFEDIINRSRLDKSLLHLEVTETALIDNTEVASISLRNIRKMGIHASIDDFGKGYCSLTYLQDFEFDTLKIDKDFVQDMTANGKGLQLVRTLLLLARDLKMDVVAEGVETEEQYNRLKVMRSSYMQGYYFSRPLPSIQIQNILSKGFHLNANLLQQKNGPLKSKKTKQ